MKIGNGSIQLPLNKRQYFVLTGGRSYDRPATFKFVKMAQEIPLPCDIDLPTQDYKTTDVKLMMKGLPKIIDLILAGEPVYIGCMGGMGRTGFVLAIVAKAFGVKHPTKFIRKHYMSHAVETPDQEAYVKNFKIPPQVYIKIAEARKARSITFQPRVSLFGWTLVGPELPRFWDKAARATNLTQEPDAGLTAKLTVDTQNLSLKASIGPQPATTERGRRTPRPRLGEHPVTENERAALAKRDMQAPVGPDMD